MENKDIQYTIGQRIRRALVVGSLVMCGIFGFGAAGSAINNVISPAPTVIETSAPTQQSSTTVKVAEVSAADYQSMAREAAARHGIDPEMFVRQIEKESGFNPNVTSHAGAHGIAQFMPETAASLGVDTSDPASSLDGAARLMKDLKAQFGDDAKALAAYNAGPGNVQSAMASGGDWLANTPAETQNYVSNILG